MWVFLFKLNYLKIKFRSVNKNRTSIQKIRYAVSKV